jgi:murein endopeptidase
MMERLRHLFLTLLAAATSSALLAQEPPRTEPPPEPPAVEASEPASSAVPDDVLPEPPANEEAGTASRTDEEDDGEMDEEADTPPAELRAALGTFAGFPPAFEARSAPSLESTPPAALAPAPETLRAMIALDPAGLGALSIGSPSAGLLFNGVPLPESPLWTIRNAQEAFGTPETVAFIEAAVGAVVARFPDSPPLCIGDLSRPDGGRLNRHASHQSGRDVDLGFFLTEGAQPDFKSVKPAKIDLERTWAIVRALVTETDVERIFVDRTVQRALFTHALSAGEDRAWLEDLFQYPRGKDDRIIQHERRHKDHMHVRFYNRRAQEWGRLAYRGLVEAGQLPPPVIAYRVRSGDTLSGLAARFGTSASAIRAANGMKGSFLRAGRRYSIPLRRIPAEGEPIVVPGRRLPPAPPPADSVADTTLLVE